MLFFLVLETYRAWRSSLRCTASVSKILRAVRPEASECWESICRYAVSHLAKDSPTLLLNGLPGCVVVDWLVGCMLDWRNIRSVF